MDTLQWIAELELELEEAREAGDDDRIGELEFELEDLREQVQS
jgi:hypothetical protein